MSDPVTPGTESGSVPGNPEASTPGAPGAGSTPNPPPASQAFGQGLDASSRAPEASSEAPRARGRKKASAPPGERPGDSGRDAGDGDRAGSDPWASGTGRRKADEAGSGDADGGGRKRRSRRRRKPAGEADGAEASEVAGAGSDQGSGDGGDGGDDAGDRPERKARRSRRRKASGTRDEPQEDTSEAAGDDDGSDEAGDERSSDDDGGTRKKRRRRGSRGGRRRRAKAEGEEGSEDGPEELSEAPGDGDEAGGADSSRRKSAKKAKKRRRSRRKKDADDAAPAAVEVIPGEDDDLPELEDLPAEAELVAGSKGRAKKAKKKGRKKAEKAAEPKPEPPREDVILVNAKDKLESRVAVVRGKRIRDLSLEVNRVQTFVHNIYRGKVVNIEPAIGAAFVDFGQGKNGFLHVSDVLPEYGDPAWDLSKLLEAREGPNDDVDLSGVDTDLDDEPAEADEDEASEVAEADDEAPEGDADDEAEGKRSRGRGRKGARRTKRAKGSTKKKTAKASKKGGRGGRKERSRPRKKIEELLKVGDKVVVQITKDAIGDKGPTLTTYISIPGRYLVLMPSLEMVGVSRKIEDEKERKRLRKIMQSFDVPGGMGLIVRTAGIGKTKADLRRDLEYLLALWDSFSKRLTHGKTPTPLYQENDLAIRTMRDLFSRRTKSVVVDDEEVCEAMKEFARKLMPEHEERIVLHDGARPIFHHYGVEQDYEKIFSRRVELPSGGSIVIDQTEALVAIDVNSGRTRSEGAVFEDIALKTNLEALAEIALQIKLRDMGGILVLDFIDMMKKSSRLTVERALREALHDDRARHKVGRISQFGLLEMTRQRLGPGLSKLLYTNCQHCRGTGRLRTPDARAQGILRRLGSALTQKGFSRVEVRTQPEVVDYLERTCRRDLDALSEQHGRELTLTRVPDQLEESVLRYLRADGREVRPGGRRKKR